MGLHRAGFDVQGVDIDPQPRYPFKFHQADAVTFPLEGFDLIWASPPCQKYSATKAWNKREHPDLLPVMRERLNGTNFCIENVPGAPMRADYILCGSQFGLDRIRRHRWFEVSWDPAHLIAPCAHSAETITVCGHGGRAGGKFHHSPDEWREAMGIDWMNREELAQAIPPAYSEYIGRQFLSNFRGSSKNDAASSGVNQSTGGDNV